ncbi:hypothetical protein FHS85_001753 [Rhodoligotrophos appendicifer]|uniref:head-tail joining protein n=1 Tax=Rhodoligotrophos appendicifer TaxID=987056 RepID=UPI001185100F|nr:hypothetical protein [Rhodoligotrophos appendicifer]
MFDFGIVNQIVTETFGEAVTIRSQGLHEDRVIKAIFDSRHYVIVDGEAGGSDLMTSITITSEDASGITADDVVVARQTLYSILDIRPLGEGMSMILLGRYSGPLAAEVLP